MNLKDSFGAIVSSRYFEWAITAIILVNAVLIGIELNVRNPTIELTQKVILLIFTVKILMRFMARLLNSVTGSIINNYQNIKEEQKSHNAVTEKRPTE